MSLPSPLAAFKVFSLLLVFINYDVLSIVSFFLYLAWDLLSYLSLWVYSFYQIWKKIVMFFKYFFYSTLFFHTFPPTWRYHKHRLGCLILSHRTVRLCSFFFFFHLIFSVLFGGIVSIAMSSIYFSFSLLNCLIC